MANTVNLVTSGVFMFMKAMEVFIQAAGIIIMVDHFILSKIKASANKSKDGLVVKDQTWARWNFAVLKHKTLEFLVSKKIMRPAPKLAEVIDIDLYRQAKAKSNKVMIISADVTELKKVGNQ